MTRPYARAPLPIPRWFRCLAWLAASLFLLWRGEAARAQSGSGPVIELAPEDKLGRPLAVPPATDATTAAASAQSPSAAPIEDVPIQSPVLLSDEPKQALPKSGVFLLPRQSQIDVALDQRVRKLRGAAVGGYGEAIVNAPFGPNAGPVVADLRRTVLFFGMNFTDRIRFFSEVELEHALTTQGTRGEVAVEQAFLDFMIKRYFNLRAGMTIVPINLINLYHEPSTFLGSERPDVDLFIVPSTWKQLVAGAFGAVGPVRYQVYVTPGLKAENFRADTGVRQGVQANEVRARDWGVVGRVDYSPVLGLNLGLSAYWARAGQGDPNLGDVPVTMAALDGKLGRWGLSVRGQLSYVHIGNTERLNAILALTRPDSGPVSRQLIGGYIEVGYDVLRPFKLASGMQLFAFGRYDRTDTQFDVVDGGNGFSRRPGNDRSVYTAGLTFRPIFEIAVKLDYQHRHTEVVDSNTNQINAAIAYQF